MKSRVAAVAERRALSVSPCTQQPPATAASAMFVRPQHQSFHPPSVPEAGGVAAHPDHVLLTVRAYIADRTNATTASSFSSDGRRVQATFFAAAPPALSHLCVHCPDAAFSSEPRVVAAHAGLVLLYTATRSSSPSSSDDTRYDFFVYRAGGSGVSPPSLDLLPKLGHSISRANVCLVVSGGGDGGGGSYAVATLDPNPSCKRYILRVHREKSGRWRRRIVTRKLLPAEGREAAADEVLDFTSTKAVPLGGGGVVAWADLRRAVLLVDVLADDPVARYVPLPEPLSRRNRECLESPGDPCFFRDVAAGGGGSTIRLVEMEYRYDGDGLIVSAGWRAVTRSWTAGSSMDWRTDSVVDFDDVARNSGGLLPLLLCRPAETSGGVEVESEKSIIPPMGLPALCGGRDDVRLYLMSKSTRRCVKGSVVAVDTGKGDAGRSGTDV